MSYKFNHNTRWVIGFLMFFGVVFNYIDRVSISHAIIVIAKDFHLTPVQQGIILSSFSAGYVAFMLIGGILVDRFGSRLISALSGLTASFFVGLAGIVRGFLPLAGTLFSVGVGGAPLFPSNARGVRAWFPVHERGKATALFDVGSYVGAALAAPLITLMIINFGWRNAFFVIALSGIVWAAVWYYFYREPEEHKHVSEKEMQHIQSGIQVSAALSTAKISIGQLLKQRQIWGMIVGFFCYNYVKNFFLTWFPSYLVAERGFTFLTVGFVALIPPLCAITGELLVGHLTDTLIKRKVSITIARKVPLCIGMLLSSVIIGAVLTQNVILAVVLLSISYASVISASTGIWAIPGDIAQNKNQVGTIGGVQNTFSNMAGIIAPIVTGYLFATTHSFVVPLVISGTLAIVGASSYWFVVGELKPLKLS